MSWGSVLSLPFIACLIFPTLAVKYPDSTSFLFSAGFVYLLTIFTSFFNGFGEGISQPASGKFISDCATERSKGFFFAYFWAFYMGSQMFGSLISGVILGYFDEYWYVIIMFVIATGSTLALFKLRSPEIADSNALRERTASIVNINGDQIRNIQQYDEMQGLLREAKPKVSIKDVSISMWNLLCTRRFLIIAPQLFWTGISIAFFSGNLMELIQATVDGPQESKFEMSNYAMIMFGLGEIFGCFFIGYIVDKFGSRQATYANIVIMSIMAGVTIIYCLTYEFGFLAFLMCFLWGFQDSAINTHA